jgi:hypothetical protein
MSGTMHPYYTVALAPGIAGLVGVGAVALWRTRTSLVSRALLALAVAATGAWSFVLLAGSSESFGWVRWIVAPVAVLAVLAIALDARGRRWTARTAVAAVLTAGLLGTGAYAVATAATAHTGSIPSVGTSAGGMGGGGTGGGFGGPGGGTPPAGAPTRDGSATTDAAAGADADTAADATTPTGGGTGMGGDAATGTELTALLSATDSTWSAAVATSQTAASLELSSGTAVMSLGGWSGSDSAVTLARFQQLVADGQVHYYLGGGQGGGPGGSSDGTSAQIAEWVRATYAATTVGGQTVYDLTAPTAQPAEVQEVPA